MEKAVLFRTIMNEPYPDHPSEDALERFLLNQSDEEEFEAVETHYLACEACVTRLEALELDLAARKMAIRTYLAEQAVQPPVTAAKQQSWFSWLTAPRLSFAGAALAACALAVTFVSVPRDVSLVAARGNETQIVSQWLPLHLHLQARDLKAGPVTVKVLDNAGKQTWQGEALVKNEEIEVRTPRMRATGDFLVQVYSRSAADSTADLVREYKLQARPGF
jgi:anti-sigma factor RsiW